jgi:hypothetical protein
MPLNTTIIREGHALRLRWGNFHVAAMALAAAFDAGAPPFGDLTAIYDDPSLPPQMFDCYPDAAFPITRQIAFELTSYPVIGKTPLNDGRYVLKGRHTFLDCTDGEVLRLLPGDELHAYRN